MAICVVCTIVIAVAFELLLTAKVEKRLVDLVRDQAKFRKVVKCLAKLEEDPRQPGLSSHPYTTIQGSQGQKVFESYVENSTPSAWRVWWHYGPQDGEITVVALGPHP